jgi:hypothetical protein
MFGFKVRIAHGNSPIQDAAKIRDFGVDFVRCGHELIAESEVKAKAPVEPELIVDVKTRERLAEASHKV